MLTDLPTHDHFLPIVEGHPLMIEIGEWTLTKALTQLETWTKQGLDTRVSVNVAASHLQRSDFAERLKAIVRSHTASRPQQLELEILETSALENMEHVSQVISECQSFGVSFALDDFGTGYSSLAYLKRLPAEVLKIDRSFVRDMQDDPEDLTILEGVISLAAAFQRQVIAEGVESREHGELLLRLGCELAQGFGIARPMPGHEIGQWATEWTPPESWSRTSAIDRNRLPTLFATVELCAWHTALQAYLANKATAMPSMDPATSRLGRLLSSGRIDASDAQLEDLKQRHLQLLDSAKRLLALRAEHRSREVEQLEAELVAQRDQLQVTLERLIEA